MSAKVYQISSKTNYSTFPGLNCVRIAAFYQDLLCKIGEQVGRLLWLLLRAHTKETKQPTTTNYNINLILRYCKHFQLNFTILLWFISHRLQIEHKMQGNSKYLRWSPLYTCCCIFVILSSTVIAGKCWFFSFVSCVIRLRTNDFMGTTKTSSKLNFDFYAQVRQGILAFCEIFRIPFGKWYGNREKTATAKVSIITDSSDVYTNDSHLISRINIQ